MDGKSSSSVLMRLPAKPITEQCLSYFYYDETSPSCLRWKFDRYVLTPKGSLGRKVVSAGDAAGHLRKDGYWTVKFYEEAIKIHRIIFCLFNGIGGSENIIVDHENGNNSDNKITNLRSSTDYLNGKNKSRYRNNSTGYTGVHINEKSEGKFYYVATWRSAEQKIGAKSFSFDKYGQDASLQKACEYRQMMIDKLKSEGAAYTERHGK